jgi:hypothetical protein
MGRSCRLWDKRLTAADLASAPAIGLVGINFALGVVLRDLSRSEHDAWRTGQPEQARRPEMETGWSQEAGVSSSDFDDEREPFAANTPVKRWGLQIHTVRTVLAKVPFGAGIPRSYPHGVVACFKDGTHTPPIAGWIYAAAERSAEAALLTRRRGVVPCLARELSRVRRDAKRYAERLIIAGYTGVSPYMDEDDGQAIGAALDADGTCRTTPLRSSTHGELPTPGERAS